MKYIVTLGGRRYTVELGPDGVELDGRAIDAATVADIEGTPVRLVTIGTEVHRVVVRRREGRGHYHLWLDGFTYDVEALDERTRTIRDLTAAAAGPAGPAPLVAPMPGLIVRVNVQAGDTVVAGQGMVVMEAMKMENELRATGAGVVSAVHVKAGTAVEKGMVLVEMVDGV
ncbi:MAG TPA: biotin/lipoyl-containing protein [Gemmatimonadaceae bacterium]|nr:biotin/lipoyl-containing protein [Gemmatimonadaceae bacterium]